ncbi:hypothetical protein JKF63_02266 [Porcisia hertigi]|uniref:Uncharacterized protein n=1 Tax=Porcisia hertigi TaxID=2761500 RepID=A0A836HL89_9TRYP|nr:hypothetical protein JKF63_02266 [Porcisia hertigi]
MSPKKSLGEAKKTSASTTAAKRRQDVQQKKALKEKADREALAQWIDAHDPLLDNAADNPIQMEELFSTILVHRTFSQLGTGAQPYDWSEFRKVLENRTASSPRWFMQLREEDLLAGADGMEGVTVDCYVIAEATQPTMAPGEYIVKVHWPYSDAEDNAPERILPLEGQSMCWRRVVKADGSDMNVFLLQKSRKTAGVCGSAAPSADNVAPPVFGFGNTPSTAVPASSTAAVATTTPSVAPGFGFGFGAAAQPPVAPPFNSASSPANGSSFSFSFDQPAAMASSSGGFSFGFSTATPSSVSATTNSALPSFGAAAAPSTAPAAMESGEVKVEPLKTSEVLFALWSRKRLASLTKDILSGSRIVREDFALDATRKIKLVMQNDRKDDVAATVRWLLLNRLFAKQDKNVTAIDTWINDCPVYDEALASSLQAFRERQLNEIADNSDVFQSLFDQYHTKMEAELQRIVAVRDAAAKKELERIDAITTQIKQHKLAEKSSFRLLKFYAKNDVLRFRPFGKISGISEMGESVDVCVPPAHVNINPFTGKPI